MGTPNSRQLYGRNVADAADRGLRLISYDRPGYGGSAPCPGRTIADCADDVRAICAALGIGRLAMWGISGGGPHVLACAALLPDLVAAAASLASPAPFGAAGLDWFAGMGQDNVDDFSLLLADADAGRAKLEKDREDFLAASAADLASGLKSLLSPVDAAVLTGELAEYLASSTQAGLTPGGRDGGTTAARRPARGGSSLTRSGSPCCCCMAHRTSSCRSAMVSGWPRISQASRRACSTTTGI